MGSKRTKEDDVLKISTSVFVTNFPEQASAKDLWNAFFDVSVWLVIYVTVGLVDIKFNANAARFHRPKGLQLDSHQPAMKGKIRDSSIGNTKDNGHRDDVKYQFELYMEVLWVRIAFDSVEANEKFLLSTGIPGWTPNLDDQNDEESDSKDEECEVVFKKDFNESDEEVQGENDVSRGIQYRFDEEKPKSKTYPPGFTPRENDVENVEMDNQKDNCDGEFGNVNNISDEVNLARGYNTYKKQVGILWTRIIVESLEVSRKICLKMSKLDRLPSCPKATDRIPKGCNSSFIALIPKTPEAKMVKDFRPISLIRSLYKIIAKILANRLVVVLGDIVNEVQSVFVADRQILDGPFILNEVLQWWWCKAANRMVVVSLRLLLLIRFESWREYVSDKNLGMRIVDKKEVRLFKKEDETNIDRVMGLGLLKLYMSEMGKMESGFNGKCFAMVRILIFGRICGMETWFLNKYNIGLYALEVRKTAMLLSNCPQENLPGPFRRAPRSVVEQKQLTDMTTYVEGVVTWYQALIGGIGRNDGSGEFRSFRLEKVY
ncbi:hypothetical protein Tco_0877207 [Tanacetum coccineum]|uniref:Reverse transcriptase domain-containing protein n=1 Tax=Tanacetum coccineum TaxID=301880 RepID=A0ABQ5BUG3_9ASTR